MAENFVPNQDNEHTGASTADQAETAETDEVDMTLERIEGEDDIGEKTIPLRNGLVQEFWRARNPGKEPATRLTTRDDILNGTKPNEEDQNG